jgi:hypothetical protein
MAISIKLTDAIVKALPVPADKYEITWDSVVKGYGIRVTSSGSRSFILKSDAAGAQASLYHRCFP